MKCIVKYTPRLNCFVCLFFSPRWTPTPDGIMWTFYSQSFRKTRANPCGETAFTTLSPASSVTFVLILCTVSQKKIVSLMFYKNVSMSVRKFIVNRKWYFWKYLFSFNVVFANVNFNTVGIFSQKMSISALNNKVYSMYIIPSSIHPFSKTA